jgi:hypothetical protein
MRHAVRDIDKPRLRNLIEAIIEKLFRLGDVDADSGSSTTHENTSHRNLDS